MSRSYIELEQEILGRANRKFVEELKNSIGFIAETKLRLESIENLTDCDLKSTIVGFHRLRGGASFFGYSDISEAAKSIEKSFSQLEEGQQIDLSSIKAELDKLSSVLNSINVSYG
jgi:chemotaxis protein histidine kinase CheA